MKSELRKYRLTITILLMAAIAAIIYIISLKAAYPVFQNTRLTDPLAEINSLVPLFYIALTIMVITAAVCFLYRVKNRGIHVLILFLTAIMLWFTRYYLAGFTWEPDSARNLGVSLKIPEILNGLVFPLSDYGFEFPAAHILEYALVNISGINNETYLHLIPLVNIILFTILVYTFTSRLFTPRAAFLATFISIAGMHYMIFIMGEHTAGILLLLTILTLVWHKGAIWRITAFLLIPVIILCHPISPILLGVFLGAKILSHIVSRNWKTQTVTAIMLVVCMAGWFAWPLTYPVILQNQATFADQGKMSVEQGGNTATEGEISGDQTKVPVVKGVSPTGAELQSIIMPEDLTTAKQYILGNAFIYPEIYTLNKMVYVIYGMGALAAIGIILIRTRHRQRGWGGYIKKRGGLSRHQVILIISVPVFLIAAVLMTGNSHDLLERGLTPAILAMSGIIASVAAGLYDHIKTGIRKTAGCITILLLVFLTLSFPVVTYSIDAYSSFPLSEKAGLEFLTRNVPLKEKVLVSQFRQMITLFQPELKSGQKLDPIPVLESGDVFVLNSTGYYHAAMRLDYSFTDNRVTRYREALSESSEITGIYYNPAFSVFLKTNQDK